MKKISKIIKKKRATLQYYNYYDDYKKNMIILLEHYLKEGNKIAVWGGGLKGTEFLHCYDPDKRYISFVIDMNEKMHGVYTSTGHLVTGYENAMSSGVSVIFVMNKVFYVDVFLLLQKNGFHGHILDADELIELNIPAQDIMEGKYSREAAKGSGEIGEVTIRDIQMVALEILREVDRICKKNGITYFLEAGSALGAYRNQGFIPCDDDIDIAMLREDYEKFQKLADKELLKGFLMQRLKKGFEYPYPYIQIVKDHTAFVHLEFKDAKMHHGIHIDVAPLDNVPEEKELREKQLEEVRHYKTLIRKKFIPEPYKSKNIMNNFIVNMPYYLLKFVPLNYLTYRQQRAFTRYKNKKTSYVGDLCTHYKRDLYFDKAKLLPTVMADFEGEKYPVPRDLEAYLEVMYDDYKQLSPREDGNIKYRMAFVSLKKNYSRKEC